jgi:hypothetical protein
MGADKPEGKKPEAAKPGDDQDLGSRPEDVHHVLPDLVRRVGGRTLNLARDASNEAVMAAILPCVMVDDRPRWDDPKSQLGAAGAVFGTAGTAYDLAQKKADLQAENLPFTPEMDARLSAYWLFPNHDTAAGTARDQDGFNRAVKKNLGKPLSEEDKIGLGVRIIQAVGERYPGKKEPPYDAPPCEQINERAEYDNAWKTITQRLKWSELVDEKGSPLSESGKLTESITNPVMRKQADEEIFARLNRMTGRRGLNILPSQLEAFVRDGTSKDAVITKDGEIIRPTDADNKEKIIDLLKTGQALTRDDAINRLILNNQNQRGVDIEEHLRRYKNLMNSRLGK